jgi:hypothetical protein
LIIDLPRQYSQSDIDGNPTEIKEFRESAFVVSTTLVFIFIFELTGPSSIFIKETITSLHTLLQIGTKTKAKEKNCKDLRGSTP